MQPPTLNEGNLERTLTTLATDGYVVLDSAIPMSSIDIWRGAFTSALSSKYAGRNGPDQARGHGGLHPPPRGPFLDPLIVENPIVFQVLSRVLGQRFFGCLPYGCNTAFPGSAAQNVHRDCGQLFPGLEVRIPPVLVVVNIALDDFTKANGATEVWPGSHQWPDTTEQEIDYLRVEKHRLDEHQSCTIEMSAGSIVFRDMRTWHRGMPNTTDQPRTMISLVYYRQYYLPDDLVSYPPEEADIEIERLSQRAIEVYRLRP